MALIASFGMEPVTSRMQAILELSKIEVELRRMQGTETAEEVFELVASQMRESLGLAASKKKK